MFSFSIVHCDLKPENVMLEQNKDLDQIKLIDFGTAIHLESGSYSYQMVGTAYYMAPEVLNYCYTEKCDIWSCGVMLFILLTGIPPFNGSEKEIFRKIRLG